MSWDPVWEEIFRSRSWGRYPPESVVRFVARAFYAEPDRSALRILEIGCGPGSGTSWYVAREGFSLCGIDASPTAVELARARFAAEGLTGEFVCGDCAALPWNEATFDAVVDVGCLACATQAEAAVMVAEVRRVLKPGGLHFSLTAKAGCWGDGPGARLDATTLALAVEGPFANIGKVRFATEDSLRTLYCAFRELRLEHLAESAEQGSRLITHWIVTCRK